MKQKLSDENIKLKILREKLQNIDPTNIIPIQRTNSDIRLVNNSIENIERWLIEMKTLLNIKIKPK